MTMALEGGGVVRSTPRPHFTPGKDPVPILQEAAWAPGPVWMGGKSCPHWDSILDRPAHSQSLYRLSCPAHSVTVKVHINETTDTPVTLLLDLTHNRPSGLKCKRVC